MLGTKYVKIDDFRTGETREYRMGFELTDVDYCKVAIVDSVNEEEVTKEQFTTVEFRFAKLMATIILISFFG